MSLIGSLLASIRKAMVPVHEEGYPFIAAALLAALLAWLFLPALLWPFLLLAGAIALFFRDPPRVTPARESLVIAPADGLVSAIEPAAPPPEAGIGDEPRIRISIFLSVYDVHINRSPVSGRVRSVAYTPGLFLNADLDKASEDNERNVVVIDTDWAPVCVVQIAGLIARRIVCRIRPRERIAAGERFGLIRFGSRCDVYLPAGVEPLVGEGQRCVAGETVLADLAGSGPRPGFRRE